jgi:hypothetical protein
MQEPHRRQLRKGLERILRTAYRKLCQRQALGDFVCPPSVERPDSETARPYRLAATRQCLFTREVGLLELRQYLVPD